MVVKRPTPGSLGVQVDANAELIVAPVTALCARREVRYSVCGQVGARDETERTLGSGRPGRLGDDLPREHALACLCVSQRHATRHPVRFARRYRITQTLAQYLVHTATGGGTYIHRPR